LSGQKGLSEKTIFDFCFQQRDPRNTAIEYLQASPPDAAAM
jgi:hypothetical protein